MEIACDLIDALNERDVIAVARRSVLIGPRAASVLADWIPTIESFVRSCHECVFFSINNAASFGETSALIWLIKKGFAAFIRSNPTNPRFDRVVPGE